MNDTLSHLFFFNNSNILFIIILFQVNIENQVKPWLLKLLIN